MDTVIPIVFPDYLIAVIEKDIPVDVLPWFSFDNIEVPGKSDAMLRYAQTREKQNTNPKRQPYDLFSNSCVHFAKGVVEAAGVGTPWMVDPRPNSYIGEFRDGFPDLDFDAKTRKLVIGK